MSGSASWAPGQAGFRPNLSTVHQVFALRHLIDESKAKRKPLYTCFVDFSKAYDRVPRHLLWQIMGDIGVPQKFVKAIESMYKELQCMVRIQGVAGSRFSSHVGVKQGCPLSPTLFGLFIDRLYFYVQSKAPDLGITLGSGRRIPMLLYADDFLLLAHSPEQMHTLLQLVTSFMHSSGMVANTSQGKTEMVIFGAKDADRASLQDLVFLIGGQRIAVVQQYKHLGVMFHEKHGCKIDFDARRSKVLRATGMLRHAMAASEAAKSIPLGFSLYDACVRPVATYASAVWATRFSGVPPSGHVTGQALEKAHLEFMKTWCRLRPSVPVWALYRELGRLPLHYFWWRDVFTFWNQVVSSPNAFIWQDMLSDAMHRKTRGTWGGEVHAFLRKIGMQASVGRLVNMQDFSEALLAQYDTVWQNLSQSPRTAADHVRLTTYHRWFSNPHWRKRMPYQFLRVSAGRMTEFIRFKLGGHNLRIELGRWKNREPREHRVCLRCHEQALDDERHLVFECPVFEPLRRKYRHLFGQEVDWSMTKFFAHRDQQSVFQYITSCLRSLA